MASVTPESWHEGNAQRPAFGHLNSYRAEPSLDAFLGIDHEGLRHLLLADQNAEGFTDDRSRGLTVATRMLEVEAQPPRRFLDLRCTDPSGYDFFNIVVNSVLDEVRRGVVPREAVVTVLSRWRRFWGTVPDTGLTADQVRGLFGELWFLLVWLIPRRVGHVGNWVGSTGARHDFQWPAVAVEAKATLSIRGHVHRIHGLDQLDPPDDGALFVFSLRMREEASAANSLVTVIERITAALSGRPDLLDTFESRLAQSGYTPAHAERYRSMLFRVVDERLYRVTPEFPRLSAHSFHGGLPEGIERVEYEVNLETKPDLIICRDPARLEILLPP